MRPDKISPQRNCGCQIPGPAGVPLDLPVLHLKLGLYQAQLSGNIDRNLKLNHGMDLVGRDLKTHPIHYRDTFCQPRLLQALFNLAWNISRDGASTASLGNLVQGFSTFIVKELFPAFYFRDHIHVFRGFESSAWLCGVHHNPGNVCFGNSHFSFCII